MDSVPCKVVEVAGTQVRIVTKCPYRKVDMWVSARWIDGRLKRAPSLRVPSLVLAVAGNRNRRWRTRERQDAVPRGGAMESPYDVY